MDRRSFMRWMSRVALVAMLLLVALPTIGRVAGQRDGSMPSMSMAMSMSMPMPASHATAAPDAAANCHESPTVPRPAPMPHHGDGDCDYCPLLAGLVVPAPLPPPALVVEPPRHVPPSVIAAVVEARHPSGLGSRGPPAAA